LTHDPGPRSGRPADPPPPPRAHGGGPGPGDGNRPHETRPPGDGLHDLKHPNQPPGQGWHPLPDTAMDPHYGQPLPEHWHFTEDPTDPSRINPTVAKLINDPDAPFGRDPQGNAYTQGQYEERFNKVSPNGGHWYNFPGNDGAVPGTRRAYTDPEQFLKDYGPQLDRVGDNDGKYLAVMAQGHPAPWEQRAHGAGAPCAMGATCPTCRFPR
jgi:hypothetical protein